MISSAKYSQESLVSNKVSYDGVWKKNENPDIFGGTDGGTGGAPAHRRWNFFFAENLRNNILGKVRKFGSPVNFRLGALDDNIGPRVILTPPRVW